MEPIVLIHGYSAESRETTKPAIAAIYGSLPRALREVYGRGAVVEIDLGRYVTLEDGVTLEDVSRALNRALEEEFPHLLRRGFHALVHSTGALVIRNWIRRFSSKPSPVRNLVHLAGANFGSGWAHVGKGQLAKWAHRVFPGGAERGIRILDALELGSDWTLDLQLHFLRPGSRMAGDYEVREHVVVGSQADAEWFALPIRYAKEDGSDGVVRVSASDLNYHYLRFGPTAEAAGLGWAEARGQLGRHLRRRGERRFLYEIKERSRPGLRDRPEIPLGIPNGCAHSGEKAGIVTGSGPRDQVMRLIRMALETRGPEQWSNRVAAFGKETETTYEGVRTRQEPSWWGKWISEPRAQYDPHAQVIFRIRDQDGRPVPAYDIFFDSVQGRADPSLPMRELFEDKHVNSVSPHIITFYLRTDAFSRESGLWEPRIPKVRGCYLEVTGVEPQTEEILYLPMRFEFGAADLTQWIRGHRTTFVDVELLRLPSPGIFRMVPY